MAQKTSELWKTLYDTKDTYSEYAFDIGGAWYDSQSVVTHNVKREMYSEFGFGNATTSSLTLTVFADNIPRAATIKRYIRLVNGDQVSEWIPSGVYFTNRRTDNDGLWDIEAFDVMRKAEALWNPRQSLVFPMTMPAAVNEIAAIMGCEIDSRTTLNASYTLDYPADYSLRQVLQYIAAAHGGNWIITGEGKLLLIPIGSEPEETYYLVTEHGKPITLGGVKLLIG